MNFRDRELRIECRLRVSGQRTNRLHDEIRADERARFAHERRADVLHDAAKYDDRGHAERDAEKEKQ